MCVCVSECVREYESGPDCECKFVFVRVQVRVCVFIYICECECVHECVGCEIPLNAHEYAILQCVCVCVCEYVCVYVCMCVTDSVWNGTRIRNPSMCVCVWRL